MLMEQIDNKPQSEDAKVGSRRPRYLRTQQVTRVHIDIWI